jgi:hypothetical protein
LGAVPPSIANAVLVGRNCISERIGQGPGSLAEYDFARKWLSVKKE